MNFLLDTNVVSEGMRLRPDEGVANWLAETDEDRFFMSVMTLGELRHGIERLPAGARRKRFERWIGEDLPARFEARVLLVDEGTAHCWGVLMAKAQSIGRPLGVIDAFLAATAVQHDLTLVTRNVSDFAGVSVRLFNPWTDGQNSP